MTETLHEMNTKRRLLLLLVLLAGVFLNLAILFEYVFGLSLGMRMGDSNNFRDISSSIWIAILIVAISAAIYFCNPLGRSRRP